MDLVKTIFGQIRKYLTPWVLLGAIGIAIILLIITLGILIASRPAPTKIGVPTAALFVIPAPTDTIPVPTTAPGSTPSPTSDVPPPPPPGVIAVGSFVQVTGTGVDGLRLHADHSVESKTDFLGVDTEVFQITDGPQEADGYLWWYLVAPYDQQRRGWAVANYLITIANP